jgi:hypothetical protein
MMYDTITGYWLLHAFVTLFFFQGMKAQEEMLKMDYPVVVSTADLHYNQPAVRSEAGMPLGNGRMGSLVWTGPEALKLQINRVDVFANNAASNNFYQRHTDYCGGVGMVDIDFVEYGDEVFTSGEFEQHLSCYDGLISTGGKGIETSLFAWPEQDVFALRVRDKRTIPHSIKVKLRMLRAPVTTKGNHSAISTFKIIDNTLVLQQEFREDDYYCASAVVIGSSGTQGKAAKASQFEAILTLAPGSRDFQVFMASAASFDPREDVVRLAMDRYKKAVATGYDSMLAAHKAWWHRFWEGSFLSLHSEDGEADMITANYYYYLYVMASSSQGKYPPKFNGMLWTTGGDSRKWGNLYWGANQSCLYNGLFPTGKFQLLEPMFKMYTAMYPSLERAAKQQWGSKGIYIPETVSFSGMPELPEDIGQEMQELYLGKRNWEGRSPQFMDYALTKMPFLSRWNWKQDKGWAEGKWHIDNKGTGAFGHVTHIFSRGAKIAYQYWQKYEYTLNEVWLRNEAYPMIRGMAEFYRNFPGVRKEADGKYHIYQANDNESVWGGHNTVEEIAAMKGIFPVAIRASEILGLDEGMRPVWQEFVQHLSELPTGADHSDGSTSFTNNTWVKSLRPVQRGNAAGLPDPNTMPIWFFDLCNPESGDAEGWALAHNTFDAYFPDGIQEDVSMNVLSKLAAAGAILGRVEAAQYLIPNQIRTDESEVLPNRMTMREGFQTTSVQRLGRVADALHLSLCQSLAAGPAKEPVIRVFPAWPEAWDASFRLLAKKGFWVAASQRKGNIEFVEIHSLFGEICQIRNPWTGPVDLYRNGTKVQTSSEPFFVLETQKEEILVLVPEGAKPEAVKRSVGRSKDKW